jgi:uncharacterized protein with GYD domain
MLFVTLIKLRKKLSKADLEKVKAGLKATEKVGAKTVGMYFTLGRYDVVLVSECPNEKAHMKVSMQFGDLAHSESMVAVTAEEAEKLVE